MATITKKKPTPAIIRHDHKIMLGFGVLVAVFGYSSIVHPQRVPLALIFIGGIVVGVAWTHLRVNVDIREKK